MSCMHQFDNLLKLIIKLLQCKFLFVKFLEIINFNNSKKSCGGSSCYPCLRKFSYNKF